MSAAFFKTYSIVILKYDFCYDSQQVLSKIIVILFHVSCPQKGTYLKIKLLLKIFCTVMLYPRLRKDHGVCRGAY